MKFDNIHWKIEDSTNESLLFYFVREGKEVDAIERLSLAKYKKLIINKEILDKKNIEVVNDEEFVDIQIKYLDEYFPLPINLKFIGVTGTNGKTSTVSFLYQLLNMHNEKAFSVGTLGFQAPDDNDPVSFGLTSPSLIDFRKYCAKMQGKASWGVIELSSHGLDQRRVGNIELEIAAWTSFSHDHLGYHGTMENYFDAKKIIFTLLKENSFCLVHEYEKELIKSLTMNPVKVVEERSDIQKLKGFLKRNFELAFSMLKNLKITLRPLDEILNHIISPPGRFECFKKENTDCVIDYAHTPDGVKNLLEQVQNTFPNKKIITVIGCGGCRDKSKRPLMLESADIFSNLIYITQDNPRFEDPKEIISDMMTYKCKNEIKVIIDRKEAIKIAIKENESEVIVIAGKGHEDYIEIKGEKFPYSDIELIKELGFDHS